MEEFLLKDRYYIESIIASKGSGVEYFTTYV